MGKEYELENEITHALNGGDLVKISVPPDTTSKEAIVVEREKEFLTLQTCMGLPHGAAVVIETSSLIFLGSVANVGTKGVIIELEHVIARKLAEELRRKVADCAE